MPASVERGLHFNLTEGRPLSRELLRVWGRFPTLPKLIARAHLSALPRAALRAEFDAQFDAFVAATGAPPRFVDGHQHVHHLPVVRNVVLDALARCPTQVAVRNTGLVLGSGHRTPPDRDRADRRARVAAPPARARHRAQRGAERRLRPAREPTIER